MTKPLNEKILYYNEQEPHRLDKWLAEKLPEHSRSFLKTLISQQACQVNGHPVKASYNCQLNDIIKLIIPPTETLDIVAQPIPLDIVYEDTDLLIVNKPRGMVVHPAPGHYQDTLVNAVMNHCQTDLSGINGILRPGIVHRIDKDTTGLLVVCKNDLAHRSIALQLKNHQVHRRYVAIVHHNLKKTDDTIQTYLRRDPKNRKRMAVAETGKQAITHYQVLRRSINQHYTYIQCQLETGRTHQIRVHMASIGHPIVGDKVYGPKKTPFNLGGQLLHAKEIGFIHPRTKEMIKFDSIPPADFQKILDLQF